MTIHLSKSQGRASSHVNLRISNWAPFSSSIWAIFVIALKCCLMQRRASDPSLNVARPLLFLAVSWLFWLCLILLHHTLIDPLHPDLQILCWLLLLAASGLFWQNKQMLRGTMASIPFYVQLLYRPLFLASLDYFNITIAYHQMQRRKLIIAYSFCVGSSLYQHLMTRPWLAATSNGVIPSSFAASILAPCLRSKPIALVWPFVAAWWIVPPLFKGSG